MRSEKREAFPKFEKKFYSPFSHRPQCTLFIPYPPPPPPNFAKPLSCISAKTTVTPRRNRKQWLCKIFSGRELGGGGVNKVLYGLCESSELYAKINQEHIILQSFNSIGTGVTYVYQYATERFQSRDQLLCQISCKKRKSFS